MKKLKIGLIAGLAVVVLAGGYLAGAHLSGGAWPTLGLPLGGDRGELRQTTLSFLEDVQFKDFNHAASYHDPAVQQDVDIPFLIERVFIQKPETLEILEYEIVFAELDHSRLRARIKARVKAKNLMTGQIREQEIQFFYTRTDPAATWYMNLESSLRPGKAKDDKTP